MTSKSNRAAESEAPTPASESTASDAVEHGDAVSHADAVDETPTPQVGRTGADVPVGYTTHEPVPGSDGPRTQLELDGLAGTA